MSASESGTGRPGRRRGTWTLLVGLTFVAVALRYPGSHELGVDSFGIHSIVNVILQTGSMGWLVTPYSYLGLAPMSYPPAVPLSVASFAAVSGLDVEPAIFAYSWFLAVLLVGTAFLLGRAASGSDLVGCLISFLVVSASGMVSFTSWILSTRGTFLVLVPFVMALLLKAAQSRGNRSLQTWTPIGIALGVMALVHLMWLMFVPLLIAAMLLQRIAKAEEAALRHRTPFSRRGWMVLLTLAGLCLVAVVLVLLRLPGAYDLSGFPTLTGGPLPDSLLTRMAVYFATILGVGIVLLPLGIVNAAMVPIRAKRYALVALAGAFLPASMDPIYGVLLALPLTLTLVGMAFGTQRGHAFRPRLFGGSVVLLSALILCAAVVAVPQLVTVPRASGIACGQGVAIDGQTYDAGAYLSGQARGQEMTFVSDDPLNSARVEAISGVPAVEGAAGLATLGFPWLRSRGDIHFRTAPDLLSSMLTAQQVLTVREWISGTSSLYDYYTGKHTYLLLQTTPETLLGNQLVQYYSVHYAVQVCPTPANPFFTYLHDESFVTFSNGMERVYVV